MILRLVRISGLDDRPGAMLIRALQIGGSGVAECDVVRELREWFRSSPREYKAALKKLQMIAEFGDLPRLNTIKRVGPGHRVIQIAGRQSRLYCFIDADAVMTLICVNTFWIGRGHKLKKQNIEIEDAERLIHLWQRAKPIQGEIDTRMIRTN
ncbi:hypothetical protein LLG95_04310 [bacterium]|nr:hypothetical protein [bacterium]